MTKNEAKARTLFFLAFWNGEIRPERAEPYNLLKLVNPTTIRATRADINYDYVVTLEGLTTLLDNDISHRNKGDDYREFGLWDHHNAYRGVLALVDQIGPFRD